MKILRMKSQHKDQKGRKGPRNMGRSQRKRIGLQVLRLEMGMANMSQMRKNHEVENLSPEARWLGCDSPSPVLWGTSERWPSVQEWLHSSRGWGTRRDPENGDDEWLHNAHDGYYWKNVMKKSAGLTSPTTLATKSLGTQALAQRNKRHGGCDNREEIILNMTMTKHPLLKKLKIEIKFSYRTITDYMSCMPEFLVWYLYSLYQKKKKNALFIYWMRH